MSTPSAGQVDCQITGAIAFLTLSAPERQNALSQAMWLALQKHALALAQNPSVDVIVLRGAGAHFAAGADISEFSTVRANARQARHYHEAIIAPTLLALLACPQVVVAAIRGSCVGGGLELACCADLRLASTEARFGLPIQKLGFALAPAEMALLLATIDKHCAAELLLEGRILSAQEALQRGLLTRIDDDLESALQHSLNAMLSAAPQALRMHKKLLQVMSQRSLNAAEHDAVFALMDSQDYQRGIQAFVQKQRAEFKGD